MSVAINSLLMCSDHDLKVGKKIFIVRVGYTNIYCVVVGCLRGCGQGLHRNIDNPHASKPSRVSQQTPLRRSVLRLGEPVTGAILLFIGVQGRRDITFIWDLSDNADCCVSFSPSALRVRWKIDAFRIVRYLCGEDWQPQSRSLLAHWHGRKHCSLL